MKPIIKQLLERKHTLTVISSNPEKIAELGQMGVVAAIGSVQDSEFLTWAFNGADAVYTMVPPISYMEPGLDPIKHFSYIGNNYADAIRQSGIKHVVNLSSWGAHRDNGTGGIVGTYYLEQIMNQLPPEISITHIRPTSFFYNL